MVGAFTGVAGANERKKGRRRPASGSLRDFHSHLSSVTVLRRVERRPVLRSSSAKDGHQFLEVHQVQHPFEVVGHNPPAVRGTARFGSGPVRCDDSCLYQTTFRRKGFKLYPTFHTASRRSQPSLALSVPLSRFTSRVGGGSAF